MIPEIISEKLARRAVDCRHWRWMPGMRVSYKERLGGRWHTRMIGPSPSAVLLDSDPLPDLTDPATVGCLLALVREAWGWPNAFACHDETGWSVSSGETGCYVELQDEASDGERYETEAVALVSALEASSLDLDTIRRSEGS